MKLKKLDALLVSRADMYSGEEVPEDEERLKYITNFSGSAGYAVISSNSSVKSVIFSDGRYELQLKKEVDAKNFDCLNGGFRDVCLFLNANEKILKNIANLAICTYFFGKCHWYCSVYNPLIRLKMAVNIAFKTIALTFDSFMCLKNRTMTCGYLT